MTDDTRADPPYDPVAHEAVLRDLGFPERVILEAVRAGKAGLFTLDPPPDLHERIMAACREAMVRAGEPWPQGEGAGSEPGTRTWSSARSRRARSR